MMQIDVGQETSFKQFVVTKTNFFVDFNADIVVYFHHVIAVASRNLGWAHLSRSAVLLNQSFFDSASLFLQFQPFKFDELLLGHVSSIGDGLGALPVAMV